MMYSNMNKLNTFEVYKKVQNMTNDDEYQGANLLMLSVGVIFTLLCLLV